MRDGGEKFVAETVTVTGSASCDAGIPVPPGHSEAPTASTTVVADPFQAPTGTKVYITLGVILPILILSLLNDRQYRRDANGAHV